jgi:hypothetical protein
VEHRSSLQFTAVKSFTTLATLVCSRDNIFQHLHLFVQKSSLPIIDTIWPHISKKMEENQRFRNIPTAPRHPAQRHDAGRDNENATPGKMTRDAALSCRASHFLTSLPSVVRLNVVRLSVAAPSQQPLSNSLAPPSLIVSSQEDVHGTAGSYGSAGGSAGGSAIKLF